MVSEHAYMNIAPPPPINDAGYATSMNLRKFLVKLDCKCFIQCISLMAHDYGTENDDLSMDVIAKKLEENLKSENYVNPMKSLVKEMREKRPNMFIKDSACMDTE